MLGKIPNFIRQLRSLIVTRPPWSGPLIDNNVYEVGVTDMTKRDFGSIDLIIAGLAPFLSNTYTRSGAHPIDDHSEGVDITRLSG
jgi:hypothetical protein